MPAVILYGPPAAGKNTVTKALIELDHDYQLYRRLKVGAGRTEGYRMTTPSYIDTLRDAGGILWENRRYGALYLVDRPSLTNMLRSCIPILHLGQVAAVKAITTSLPDTHWTVVWLWCPRHVALKRITERGTGDTAERLRTWDETESLPEADISINTVKVHPDTAAATIRSHVERRAGV